MDLVQYQLVARVAAQSWRRGTGVGCSLAERPVDRGIGALRSASEESGRSGSRPPRPQRHNRWSGLRKRSATATAKLGEEPSEGPSA